MIGTARGIAGRKHRGKMPLSMKQFSLIVLALTAGAIVGAYGIVRKQSTAPEPIQRVEDTRERLKQIRAVENDNTDAQSVIIDSLAEILGAEVVERQFLEGQIVALTARISELESRIDGVATDNEDGNTETVAGGPNPLIDAFIDAGFTAERAEYLKRIYDGREMRRLHLVDQMTRNQGRNNDPNLAREWQELRASLNGLRTELGDDDYDRYLYATGQPNRLSITDVLEGSPAKQAGIRPGDVLVSYAGQRVFGMRGVQALIHTGTAGGSTQVIVDRKGRRVELYLPRGPMGVQMNPAQIRP